MADSDYGDTKMEKWMFRHKGAIQFALGVLNGFAIGLFVRGLL